MNIFRVMASGKQTFREEFVSAFLAYLLSPKMDHGLGAKVLSSLLAEIGKHHNKPRLINLAEQFGDRLRSDLFSDEAASVNVELELNTGKDGVIDIVVNYDNWFILIENKIYHQSIRPEQVEKQYGGLKNLLTQKGIQSPKILVIYLVPAIAGPDGWSSSQASREEVKFSLTGEDDYCSLVTWQPTDNGNKVSIVGILRNLLRDEAQGNISPMSYEVRQTLLAFIDFILGEFRGYPYDRATEKVNLDKRKVASLLTSTEDIYVGIQYGMAGVITRAWKKRQFLNEELSVSNTPRGWQYLPLIEFKILTEWALDPGAKSLSGIQWSGKPFATRYLYLVSKSAGAEILIGVQGGLHALKAMSESKIRERKFWEVSHSNQEKNWQWFTGIDFCRELESKGIHYTGILDNE